MGIEAGDGEARGGDAEAGARVMGGDGRGVHDGLCRQVRDGLAKRQVNRHRHDRQQFRPDEHHRAKGTCLPLALRQFAQPFRMAGMVKARLVEHILGDGVGDEATGLPVSHQHHRALTGARHPLAGGVAAMPAELTATPASPDGGAARDWPGRRISGQETRQRCRFRHGFQQDGRPLWTGHDHISGV